MKTINDEWMAQALDDGKHADSALVASDETEAAMYSGEAQAHALRSLAHSARELCACRGEHGASWVRMTASG